jgi:hypothetical protein
MWDDPAFYPLSPAAKLAYIYALSGPIEPRLPGIVRLNAAILADEMRCKSEADRDVIRQGFQECLDAGVLVQDSEMPVVWVPGRIEFDAPINPNVLKRIMRDLVYVHDCEVKSRYLAELRAHVAKRGDGFLEVFDSLVDECSAEAAAQVTAFPFGDFGAGSSHGAA